MTPRARFKLRYGILRQQRCHNSFDAIQNEIDLLCLGRPEALQPSSFWSRIDALFIAGTLSPTLARHLMLHDV